MVAQPYLHRAAIAVGRKVEQEGATPEAARAAEAD